MIEEVLRSLGITCNYIGYRQAVVAIRLALEDETRLYSARTRIYPVVAEQLSCSFSSVEENIRTILDCAWTLNKQKLIKMAGYEMIISPSVVRFLSIVVVFIQRKKGCHHEIVSGHACQSIRQNE